MAVPPTETAATGDSSRHGWHAAIRLCEAHRAPETPWTQEYVDRHRALVSALLDDPAVLAMFAAGAVLPPAFGIGFDERVIEYPWLFAQHPSGRTLDAGSTLNHRHILDRVQPSLESLCITTLAPEAQAFVERGVSYSFADLRCLPFRDAWFDTVVCLSTLEHVGMDNECYGAPGDRAPDPDEELAAAARELRRVTRPGGRIMLSVPFGRREDHRWFRQLDGEDLGRLTEVFRSDHVGEAIYQYTQQGWMASTRERAAAARYRDFTQDPSPVSDRAAAARAVACVCVSVDARVPRRRRLGIRRHPESPAVVSAAASSESGADPVVARDLVPQHVQAVYTEFLGREAQPDEISLWMAGGSLRALVDGVLVSGEYAERRERGNESAE